MKKTAASTLRWLWVACIWLGSCLGAAAQEICNNGKDDDNDGLVDIRDPDCQCRYTVNGNMLRNASFENYDHCPVNYIYATDYNIAQYWEYGTYTNINQANYYHNLRCAYDSGQVMLYMPPAKPIPDGSGFMAIFQDAYINKNIPENQMTKGYIGQCLETPLKAGEDYTLSFDAGRFSSWDNRPGDLYPFTVAVFGKASCDGVPFGKVDATGNGCPANYPGWVLLGKTTVFNSKRWVQSKISLSVPFDIKAIQIGTDCAILEPIVTLIDSTTFLDYHQYYLDDLHLLPTRQFPFVYVQLQAQDACSDKPVLHAPAVPGASYQWYRDSIAIAGATDSLYQPVASLETHSYNVMLSTPAQCIISEPLAITANRLDGIHIPADTLLCASDSLVLLAPAINGVRYKVNGLAKSMVSVSQAGSYHIVASTATGCEKVFDCVVTKIRCDSCHAFIPTAFTPNNDGLNDFFRIKLDCRLAGFRLMVYDRWGQKIYDSNRAEKAWDGTYNGTKSPNGSYAYLLQYQTLSGQWKSSRGTFLLIR